MTKKSEKTVVLVNPHHKFGSGIFRAQRVVLPLGLLAVATPLDFAGYRVKIIDQQTDDKWKEHLVSELERGPVCVGLTVKTGIQILFSLEVSEIVKKYGNVPVVWGGCHPSLLPSQTLENKNIDIIVQGEGEETFFELVKAIEEGRPLKEVKGIWYKEDGKIKGNAQRAFIDLNEQPPLAYHLIDVSRYFELRYGEPYLRFFSSRGCNYHCTFCYNTAFNEGKYRAITSEETIRRIKILKEQYGIKGVLFSDDNFFGDVKRAREILEGLVRETTDISLFKLDIRADILYALDDDFLDLLKRAGCRNVSIGLESGSERVLKLIKKNLKVSQILAINRRLKAFGIQPSYTFMMGFPTETLEELRETASVILQLIEDNSNIVKKLHIYTPYPGTELFDLSVEHGLQAPDKLEDWSGFNFRTVNLPWVSRRRAKLLEMFHFCSIPLEENSFFNPTIDIHPFFRMLARLYRPLAFWRVRHFFFRFPLDMKLGEWTGLYERQA